MTLLNNSAAKAQALCAATTVLALLAYAVWPDGRGAALQLLCLIPVAAMLVLKPHDMLIVSTLGLGLLVITLVALSVLPQEGLHFDPMQDGLSGLMVCLILPLVAAFAYRHTQRRESMAEHRQALSEALDATKAMAARDPLSGLLNQQHMSNSLNQEFKRAQRANAPMSIALLDLDHLRAYNEQHGHEAGDQILCRLADQLSQAFRENEVVARWSGAAFMVIFTDSHLEQATVGMERLRQAVASSQLGLSFSAAVVCRREGDRLDDLLGRAQANLQRAKVQGRDRIVSTP